MGCVAGDGRLRRAITSRCSDANNDEEQEEESLLIIIKKYIKGIV